ncbi:PTS sugar transporter subunit IIB [Ignavigranum ruoffiae]|uniref:PTS sugar transporter subunit IIB n=1 Tax=Ignavigranum ruoffiae TaxID=89093 RepID=UPI0024AD8D18|nr:PTS sugar transporter subunit IIB [Ignavigranum ruoffiae]
MYKALIACRAGMGSSVLLKIKVDQVIKENNMPIETEHGNLDSVIGFTGDLLITMEDLTNEMKDKVKYALGVRNIVDKKEIQEKLQNFLDSKE